MTVFARSDLAHVYVSGTHGGCGQGHSRPVEHGAPARLWKLDCAACEDHLRHDPLWSSTISEIPETHDEKIRREDMEKRGARNQSQMTALALAKLAGIPGAADALGMAMGSDGASLAACPDGHPAAPGAKFCTECGAPVGGPAPVSCGACGMDNDRSAKFCTECGSRLGTPATFVAAGGEMTANQARELQDALNAAADESAGKVIVLPPGSKDSAEPEAGDGEPEPPEPDLWALHFKTLQKMCRDARLPGDGGKAELIARLQGS